MNISTYESRIKALEDQINPPEPSGEGLLSVTVTPDITLKDGTSLNAKLAAMMPIEATGVNRVSEEAENLTVGAQYSITITPASDWYAIYAISAEDGTTKIESGEKGRPLTFTSVTEENGGVELHEMLGATPTLPATEEDAILIRMTAHEDAVD